MIFKKIRNIFRWIGYLAGVSILFYQIFISVRNIIGKQLVINIPLLIIALTMTFFSLGIQMLAWKSIMEILGIKLSYVKIIEGYIPSFLPRYLPGTIWGYLSRSEWLYQEFGVSYKQSNAGSLLEILISLLSNIFVIGISFSTSPFENVKIIVSGIILCIALFWLLVLLGKFAPNWIWLKRNWISFHSVSFKLWITSVFLFILTWVFNGIGLGYVIKGISGIGIGLDIIKWFNICGIFSLSWLLGFLVLIAPAGLGFRELAMAILVSNFFSLPLESGGTISVVLRLIIFLSEFFWLLGSFFTKRFYLYRTMKNK